MASKGKTDKRYFWGVVLIILGVIFLAQEIFNVQILSEILKFWPVLLILWGVTLIGDKR